MEDETYRSLISGIDPEDLQELFSVIKPREKYVLEQYFGEPHVTLREIGKVLGVQGERVRCIREVACRKLYRKAIQMRAIRKVLS